ncbi:MAG: hypothetical protein KQH53_18730 [Desulfarculaceae bacterium]|nr:hypothetical protein [Desulfarculaceae bacterium]
MHRPARLLMVAVLLLLAALLACAPAYAPPPPGERPDLTPGSALWDTPATAASRASGGLTLERPYPREGRAWVFTGKAPAALASKPLALKPGKRYGLSLWLRRQSFVNDHYLWLNFLGREHRLDAHCVVGGWQKITVTGIAPPGGQGSIVIRNHSDSRLLLSQAVLEPLPPAPALAPARPLAKPGAFPVGAYLNRQSQLAPAKACGLDTVVLGSSLAQLPALLTEARALGLGVILIVPPGGTALDKKISLLRGLDPTLLPVAFYPQDEPEIRSFPLSRLLAARKALAKAFPAIPVVTALVRPEAVAQYAPAYDAVFMDQYPVPTQPLNWLADSITQARGLVRPGGQVWGVVQAFGGGAEAPNGWSRPPRPEEMNALAASALTAGADGLLFYNWRLGAADPTLGPAICRLAGRLRRLGPWLPLIPGLPPGMTLKHLGRVRSDPGGGPAVRAGWGRCSRGTLILLVNTTPHTAEVALGPVDGPARRLWHSGGLAPAGGQLRAMLPPREARAWLLPENGKD